MKRKHKIEKMQNDVWENLFTEQIHVQSALLRSFSHEMSNNIAIITESCGLLDDYRLMGTSLSDENFNTRMVKIFQTIERRAEQLAQMSTHLNRFAHQLTSPITEINLFIEELLFQLHRFADLKKIELIARLSPTPLSLNLSHPNVHVLCYLILKTSIEGLDEEERLTVATATKKNNVLISFTPSSSLAQGLRKRFEHIANTCVRCFGDSAVHVVISPDDDSEKVKSITISLPMSRD